MTLLLPPTEHGVFVIRALKSLALADGAIHPQEQRLIEIAAETLGLDVDVAALETIEPDELASGLSESDSREALMKHMVLLSTLDAEVSEDEVALLER